MDERQLYDRYAAPHLPKEAPYGAALRETFCANAADLVEWVVDAGSALLRDKGGDVPMPVDALCDHVVANASVLDGSLLTRVHPCDRLAVIVDEGDRTRFGPMMVGLMVLHIVRAADAVSVGIANRKASPRIDVTSRPRDMLNRTLAEQATGVVLGRLAGRMPELDDIAYEAARAWTRRNLY